MIFVDVDGVLIPLRARPGTAGGPSAGGNPLLDRIDPADGDRLRALPGELVWASTWMDEANQVVAPRLGLPALPFVEWPDDEERVPPGVHWKTAALVRWAAGRAFVWLDDEIGARDKRWVAAHHPGPALLHRVDAGRGLTGQDVAAVRRWLAAPAPVEP